MRTFMKTPIAIVLGGAIAMAAAVPLGAPAGAAPLSMNASVVKEAAPDDVINVHRRYRRNGAIVAGLALGIIGAVIAHQEYKRYRRYHDYHYYYYEPYPRCIRRHGLVYCR
jgi:hypothetical protein